MKIAPVEKSAVCQVLELIKMSRVGLVVLDVELIEMHQRSLGGQPQGENSEAGQPITGFIGPEAVHPRTLIQAHLMRFSRRFLTLPQLQVVVQVLN